MATQLKILARLISSLYILTFSLSIHAQDPFFLESQQIKGYLNPALTGINGALQAKVLAKNQFHKTSKFLTGGLSIEQSFPCYRLDVGTYYLYDIEGDGLLSTGQLGITGVYTIPYIHDKNNIHNFRGGLKISHTTKRIDWEKLVFSDQINKKYGLFNSDGILNTSSFTIPSSNGASYLSVSGGFIYKSVIGLVNKYRFTVGASFDNITNLFVDKEYDTLLDITQSSSRIGKYSIYISSELPFARKMNDKLSFNPSLIYQNQRTLSNLQLGFMLNYGKILNGGIFMNFGDFNNIDEDNKMLIGVFTFPLRSTKTYQYSLTLQYAHNVSSLDNILGQTFQITLSYILKKDGCNTAKVNITDCYDFIKGEILYEDAFLRPINGINK